VYTALKIIFFILIAHHGYGQTTTSLEHDGLTRGFSYYIPTSWNSEQEMPLLIVMHGLTQTGAGLMGITNFNDVAESNNFIVCYPNGENNSWNANMNVSFSQADDIGFIETLSEFFIDSFNIDPLRKYLCGFSTGGFMAHKLACESTHCFAGIATVSGNMSDTTYNNCAPLYSTSVLHIHGTNDPVVSYNGSPTTGYAVDSIMEKWRGFINCDSPPVFSSMPNPNAFDLSYPERYTYSNWADGKELELIKVIGGGHQWPGIATLIGGTGTINMDFYSPQEIWDFLEDKSCASTVSISESHVGESGEYKIINLLGQEVQQEQNTIQFHLYEDGFTKKVVVIEN
jgi:polyhydroxybutyrate depolymerase